MANKLYEETYIQAIADSIRGKTGKTDTMTVAEMSGEIDSIEVGLPESTLAGLENGWDVMFYDEYNEGLAFYSIKQGHTIEAPVYNCKNWQDADGAVITFPYTPTADAIFYANNSTYASQLYEFYGVDSAVYPYLFIDYYRAAQRLQLAFGTELKYWYQLGGTMLKGTCENLAIELENIPNLATLVSIVTENIPSSSVTEVTKARTTSTTDTIYATNYALDTTDTLSFYAIYRLDQ